MKTKYILDGLTFEQKEDSASDDYFEDDAKPVFQPSEMRETLKELNRDEIDPNTRMSAIDMRSRLHPFEIVSVLALDSLVALGVASKKCLAFTRQKKRLAISLDGKGREEMIEAIDRKNTQEAKKSGFGEKMKTGLQGFFSGNQGGQQ